MVPNTRPRVYLFTALVRHSQSLSLPSLKVWCAIKQSGEILCAHYTCMAGLGEACSHVAALLFTADANTKIKAGFSTTSLPCSWLPKSFQFVPYIEVKYMDFKTPNLKRKLESHQCDGDDSSRTAK